MFTPACSLRLLRRAPRLPARQLMATLGGAGVPPLPPTPGSEVESIETKWEFGFPPRRVTLTRYRNQRPEDPPQRQSTEYWSALGVVVAMLALGWGFVKHYLDAAAQEEAERRRVAAEEEAERKRTPEYQLDAAAERLYTL